MDCMETMDMVERGKISVELCLNTTCVVKCNYCSSIIAFFLFSDILKLNSVKMFSV